MKKLKCLLILGFLIVTACAKHAGEKENRRSRTEYGSVIADKTLVLRNVRPVEPKTFSRDAVVTISSADWFRLADLCLQDQDEDSPINLMGQNLLDSFYKIPRAATEITALENPPGSPYGQAAIWFAKPILTKKIADLFESAKVKIGATAEQVKVNLEGLPKPYPPPEDVLERIISSLHDFKEKLVAEKGTKTDSVIDAVVKSLDTKYIADLDELLKSVTWNPEVPVSASLQNLYTTLGRITEVSDLQRRHLLTQVGLAVSLSAENEAIRDPEGFMVFLGDVWLAKEMRKNFPDRIKKIFVDLTDKQLFALATLNQPAILEPDDWNRVKNETDRTPLPDRSFIALYLDNQGKTLTEEEYKNLQAKAKDLDDALSEPEFSDLAKVMANVPSDVKEEQRFALVSAWLAIPERTEIPTQTRDIFKNLDQSEVEMLTTKSSVNVNSAQVVDSIGILPKSVVDAFANLDQGVKNITAKGSISLASRLHFGLSKYRFGIINILSQPHKLDEIKKLFSDAIVHATRERLDLALIPIAESLGETIQKALVPTLDEKAKKADDTIASTVNQYGRYYLGKLVFGVDGLKKNDSEPDSFEDLKLKAATLPLIENASVQFSFSDKRWSQAKADNESTSEILGLALGLVPRRIERKPPQTLAPSEQVAIEYEMVSKLLAIAGYHDPEGNLVSSLNVAMDSKFPGSLLDIAKYDPTKIIFATPDVLKIKNQFFLDDVSRISPRVSVGGQMELLRAYSHLMKYLKPWFLSAFDVGLGALRIDEEETLKPFNKGDYFLLSAGLGVAILKNIPYKMLGLITADDSYVDGTKLNDPVHVAAVGAVLTDYTRNGAGHHVYTKDISRAILAMSEFYEETADLGESTHPMIIANVEGDKLSTARNTLHKLIVGMVLFSSNHLMMEDGGFAQGFDLETMKPFGTEGRALNDQLLMEEAFLKAGQSFNSGFMLSRAFDNFFFLNNKFWSEGLGFYRTTELDAGDHAKLIDVARAIRVVKQTLSLDVTRGPKASSQAQMRNLLKLWTSRFFGTDALSLDPVYLLSDFSL